MFSGLLHQYKRELNEFVETVKEDTSHVLSSAAEKLAKLNVDSDAEDDDDRGARGASASLKLAKIVDFETFLEVDLEHGEQLASFEEFASSFQLSSREDQMQAAGEALLDLYDAYVPDRMTHENFWMRYFYFQHVQRRARLLAGDMGQQDEEELSWGDDDEEEDDEDDDGAQDGAQDDGETSGDDDDDTKPAADVGSKGSRGAGAGSASANALAEAKMRAAMAEQTVEDLRTQVERLSARVEDLERENERLRREQDRSLAAAAEAAPPAAPSPSPSPTPAEAAAATDKGAEDRVQRGEIEQMHKEDLAETLKANVDEADSDLGVWEVDDSVPDGSSSATSDPSTQDVAEVLSDQAPQAPEHASSEAVDGDDGADATPADKADASDDDVGDAASASAAEDDALGADDDEDEGWGSWE